MSGRLIGVVGPSGVGKDSVIEALAASGPGFAVVQRVITRAPDLGGEDYRPVSEAEFLSREAEGAFCLSWQAHGLHYGIPVEISAQLSAGTDLLVNLSRSVLSEAARRFPGFIALNITATPETLSSRLKSRGRESFEEIERRLSRNVLLPRGGVTVLTVSNDGPLETTIDDILSALAKADVDAIRTSQDA